MPTTNNIIYINCGNIITATTRHLFFLDIMEDLGYHVEYWGLASCFYPDMQIRGELTDQNYVKFDSIKSFENQLLELDKHHTVIVMASDLYYPYREIFKALNKSGLYIIRIFPYAGAVGIEFSMKEKIKRIFSSNLIQKFKRNWQQKTYLLYFKHFVNNQLFKDVYSSCQPRTKAINHPDYENYLNIRNQNNSLIDAPFFVFLDNYFPLHYDLKAVLHLDLKDIPAMAAAYQQSMKHLFDLLEAKYHKKVIVAAHPKSDYRGDEFGERQIIKYQTDNLVKNADGIISHYSNSNSYTALFDKAVVFVSNRTITNCPRFLLTLNAYAQQFHKKVFNVDTDDFEQMDFSKIETTYREAYIYKYLTTKETENISNKDIFKKELKRIFEELSQKED